MCFASALLVSWRKRYCVAMAALPRQLALQILDVPGEGQDASGADWAEQLLRTAAPVRRPLREELGRCLDAPPPRALHIVYMGHALL